MNMNNIVSKDIESMGWCEFSNVMQVKLKTGYEYHYLNVTKKTMQSTTKSTSIDKFIKNEIQGNFIRMEGVAPAFHINFYWNKKTGGLNAAITKNHINKKLFAENFNSMLREGDEQYTEADVIHSYMSSIPESFGEKGISEFWVGKDDNLKIPVTVINGKAKINSFKVRD